MKPFCTAFFLVYLTFLNTICAQDPASINYTTKDGLISNNVYHIMQDSKGYLWFSTDKGVSRFNGSEFKNYGLNEGLDGEDVFLTKEDKDGNIWIATHTPSLYIFKDNHIQPYWFNEKIKSIARKKRVITSILFSNDSILIGFQYDGYLVFNKQGLVPDIIQHEGKVVKIKNGQMLNYSLRSGRKNIVSTPRLTIDREDTLMVLNENSDFRDGFRGPSIYSMIYSKNILLVSNYNLLYVIRHNQSKIISFDKPIDCIFGIDHQEIMIGFLGGGIAVINHEGIKDIESNCKFYFKDHSVTSIINGQNESYWFATRGNGVYYVPNFKLNKLGFTEFMVSGIQNHKDEIIVGYSNGSVVTYSQRNNEIKTLVSLRSKRYDKPQFFAVDTSGKLYIELVDTSKYLLRSEDIYVLDYQRINGYVREILVTCENEIWLGTDNHVYKLYNDTLKLIKCRNHLQKEVKVFCNVIYKSVDNTLWLGTNNGVFVLREEEFVKLQGFPNVEIADFITYKGVDIIVSKYDGIYLYDGKQVFTSPELISIKNVNDAKVFEANIYFVLDKKVVKVDYANNEIHYKELVFPYSSVDISEISFSNGIAYYATTNGVYYCRLDQMEKFREERPQINFMNIKLNGLKEYYDLNSITTTNKDIIEMKVNKVIFSSTKGKIKLRKKKINQNSKWNQIESNNMYVRIENQGLEYLQIAYESDISDNILYSYLLYFNKESGFFIRHKGVVFYFFISLLFTFSILNRHFNLKKQLVRSVKLKFSRSEITSLKLQLLQSKMNPHFTFNILNSIQSYLVSEDKFNTLMFINKYSKFLRNVLVNSDYENVKLVEEIEFLKRYVEIENVRFNGKISFIVKYGADIDPRELMIPTLIIQPILENSIKYGFKTGIQEYILELNIIKNNNFLEIIVFNTGGGIEESKSQNQVAPSITLDNDDSHVSKGIAIVKERLAFINGKKNADKLFELKNVYLNNEIIGVSARLKFPIII